MWSIFAAWARKRHAKANDCVSEEMASKIRTSPHIEKLVQEILNLPENPPQIEVRCNNLYVTGSSSANNKIIWFSDCKLSDIPENCRSILADALANTPQLTKYYRSGKATFNGEITYVLELKDSAVAKN